MPNYTADLEPALKVIREHKAAAEKRLTLIEAEREELEREMSAARGRLQKLAEEFAQLTAEARAHTRVLQQITGVYPQGI